MLPLKETFTVTAYLIILTMIRHDANHTFGNLVMALLLNKTFCLGCIQFLH